MRFIYIFWLLFLNSYALAQYPTQDFSSPQKTMNYFLKTMKGFKQGDPNALEKAILVLNYQELNMSSDAAKDVAINLINTLDRIELIDIDKIPTHIQGNQWTFIKKSAQIEGQMKNLEISLVLNTKGQWLFSDQTIKDIGFFKQLLKDRNIAEGVQALSSWQVLLFKYLPPWFKKKSFIIFHYQWIGLFLLILIGYIVTKLTQFYSRNILFRIFSKKHFDLTEEKANRIVLPISLICFSIVWRIFIPFLSLEESWNTLFQKGISVVFSSGFVLAIFHVVDIVSFYFQKLAQESENKFDDILVPLVRKSAKTFVVAVGVIVVGDSLSLDVKGLIAGLGIGGLGVALAAKDTLGNIFGSITVLVDRPFRIGDWVTIGDKVEGTVEEVGLRCTRIRTFYDSLITVPNGQLTNVHIDNYGQRRYRRYSTHLSLQYDTPVERIEAFCEGIREIIVSHPYTRKDMFHVYLNQMGASSLDIMLYLFWSVPDWASELNEKHRLLLDILRLGKSLGIEFAFPTQTLHVVQSHNPVYENMPIQDLLQLSKKSAEQLTHNDLTLKGPRSSIDSLT